MRNCEDDAISRQAVIDYIDKMPSELTADGRRMIRRRTLEEYISDTLPSVTPKQKMGHWIAVEDEDMNTTGYFCSECDLPLETEERTLFCPNCGAKMETESEDKK